MDWSAGGHFPDLVEEDRAAIGRLEQTALLLPGIGERAALVAEQLALQQLLGQRGTRDVDEGTAGPVAVVVDGFRGQVLAGSGLASQEHGRGRTCRDARQQRLDLRHRRRRPDDGVESVFTTLCRPKRPDLAAKTAGLERLLDEQHDFIEVERLVDVVVRTALHRLDGVLDRRKRRHENDQRLRRLLLDMLQHTESVAVRQLEIEQDQVDIRRGLFDGCCRRSGLEDVVSLLLQALLERPAQQRLVVDDQQRGTGHLCSIPSER